MKHVLSTEEPNSHGFVVKTDGIDLNKFLKRPVLLHEHDRKAILGKWENIQIEGKKLTAEPKFSKTAEKQRILNEEGYLDGVSVGISYKNEDAEEDEESGLTILHKSTLFEASLVTFPANEECLQLRLFNEDSKDYIDMTKKSEKELKLQDEVTSLKKEVEQHKKLGEELKATKVLLSTQEEIVKKVQAENEKLKTALASLKTSEQDKFLQKAFDDNIIDKGQHEAFKKLDFSVVKRTIDNMTPKSLAKEVEDNKEVNLSTHNLKEIMEMYETNPELFNIK